MKLAQEEGRTARSRVVPAIVVAVGLLGVARWGYGHLDDRYSRAFRSVPIPAGSLAGLTLSLGPWQGRDEPMSEALIRATDTDDHVSRRYLHSGTGREVSLWIGYGGRLRDLMPHRPEICYPGNGYTLQGQREVVLTAADGSAVPCRVFHFARGSLQSQQIAVLNYYLVDGVISPDVAVLRREAMRLGGRRTRYVAQVQILCTYDDTSREPAGPAESFACDSAGEIRRVVDQAVSAVAPHQIAGE